MSKYEIVAHQPPPEVQHRCGFEETYRRPEGINNKTIVACVDCGQLWYASSDEGLWSWYKLRWYHWNIRKALKP